MIRLTFLAASAAALGCATPAHGQQSSSIPDVKDLSPAAVPLIADPLDLSQRSDPIWVDGEQPAARTIATLKLRPVEAVIAQDSLGEGYPANAQLMMAITAPLAAELWTAPIRAERKLWCTRGAGSLIGRIACFRDGNGDGKFDGKAIGLGETPSGPEQLVLVSPFVPLDTAISYRPARQDEIVRTEARFLNCARDHSNPRFSFAVQPDPESRERLEKLAASFKTDVRDRLVQMLATGFLGTCRRADRAPLPAGAPDGSVAAQLHDLTILVGPKEQGAKVQLLGLRHPDKLYRLVRNEVLAFEGTETPIQRALALKQKFDQPVVMVKAVSVRPGERKAGDELMSADLAHGYTGVTTREIKIRTLLTGRSVPAGAAVYGVPMSSQRVTTINGVPITPRLGPSSPDNVRLTWCMPVEDKGKWTATCLPEQDGRHTIVKGQSPAFEVRGLSYGADTTTNEGPVPVERKESSLGRPLQHRFFLAEATRNMVRIRHETVFGDTVVNTTVYSVTRPTGKSVYLNYGGAALVLEPGATDATVVARSIQEGRPGSEAKASTGIVFDGPVISPPVSNKTAS